MVSVTSSSRSEAGQPGAGQDDARRAAPSRTSSSRVSTLPRMSLNDEAEAERGELGGPTRGAGADDGTRAGSSPRVQSVAGDEDVARVLAGGHGGDDEAGLGGGRAGP